MVYECLQSQGQMNYAADSESAGANYASWTNYSSTPYTSMTHGQRYVNNYANDVASAYARYEDAGVFPEGSVVAKDSFLMGKNKSVIVGPLFLMEKMAEGWNPASGDWKYTMIMNGGNIFGVTNGKNSDGMQFCIDCHVVAEQNDHLFFLPDEYRN